MSQTPAMGNPPLLSGTNFSTIREVRGWLRDVWQPILKTSQDSKYFTSTIYVTLGTTQQLRHKYLLGAHWEPRAGRVGGKKTKSLPMGNFNPSLGPVRVTEHVHSPPSHSKSQLHERGGKKNQNTLRAMPENSGNAISRTETKWNF